MWKCVCKLKLPMLWQLKPFTMPIKLPESWLLKVRKCHLSIESSSETSSQVKHYNIPYPFRNNPFQCSNTVPLSTFFEGHLSISILQHFFKSVIMIWVYLLISLVYSLLTPSSNETPVLKYWISFGEITLSCKLSYHCSFRMNRSFVFLCKHQKQNDWKSSGACSTCDYAHCSVSCTVY